MGNSKVIIHPTSAEIKVVHDNLVNTIASAALAPCVVKTPGAMLLSLLDQQILVFYNG